MEYFTSPAKLLRAFGLEDVSIHAIVKEDDAAEALHRMLGQWTGTQVDLNNAINAYDEHGISFPFPFTSLIPTLALCCLHAL